MGISIEERLDRIEGLLRASLPAPEFYSIKQAARVVGVSADHIRRAVVSGVLAASNVGTMGKPTYRVACADLLGWVDMGKAGAIASAPRRRNITPVSRHHRQPAAGHSGVRDS
jgi:excisionase family DNA binding protein